MPQTPFRLNSMTTSIASSSSKIPVEATKRYRSKVVDVKDPKKIGRVKIWIPSLMYGVVSENDGIWAMPGNNSFVGNKDATSNGSQDCGSLIIPPKDSYVWVVFEDGDFDKPIYVGGMNVLADESVPVENQNGSQYYNKWTILKSPQGRQIFISDDPDDESIIIRGKQKNRSARNKTSDPREPRDSMYFELWEKNGEECAILKDGKGQFFLLDTANDRVRIQHTSGSFIEFTSTGDILIQAANNIYLNSVTPYKEEHL